MNVEWKYYRDGKIVPYTEDDIRHVFDRWRVLSDDRGAAIFLIEQMWAEIDRLRALAGAVTAGSGDYRTIAKDARHDICGNE